MKIKWSIALPIFVLILSILACNLPSPQEVNAAGTAIALTFQAETAQASVNQPNLGFTSAASPSSTSAPAATIILPTATPTGTFFVTTTGANCRSGPSQAYPVLTTFPAGTYVTIVAHNSDNTWWLVLASGSLNCRISGVVGYTTGNPGGVPFAAAPPLPTATLPPAAIDSTPPGISDVHPLSDPVSYYNNGCSTHLVEIAARIHDDAGVSDAYIKYHYKGNGGYIGSSQIQAVTDQASGGQYGFSFYTNSELAGDDGYIIYEVFAKDGAGNLGSSGEYHLQVDYCP